MVRRLRLQDKLRWLSLRKQLWPGPENCHAAEIEQFYRGESIDIEVVFVADSSDKDCIGFIEVNVREFAEGSRRNRVPYVEAWFVEKPFRGLGIGKSLMSVAENWAKELGYDELASDTTLENIHSIDLHKKLGFKEVERVVCFLKRLK